MNKFITFFEKYGLLFVLLNCFAMLPPDLSSKVAMMDLDLEAFNSNQSGGNFKKQISWILPLFIYLLALYRSNLKFKVNYKYKEIFAFFSVVGLILITSIFVNSTSFALKRGLFQSILIFVIFYAAYYSIKRGTFVNCINYLVFSIIFFCLISILSGNGFIGNSLVGWASTKNLLGAYLLCAIVLFQFANAKILIKDRFYKIQLVSLFFFLLLTGSKTSLALALLSLVLFNLRTNNFNLIFVCISSLIIALFIVLPGFAFVLGYEWHLGLYMEPETLTGRGLIWETLYHDLIQAGKMLFGYGYGSYFGTGIIPDALDDTYSFLIYLNSAHNGYIDLVLQFGFIISIILLVLLVKIIVNLNDMLCTYSVLVIFLHNINESSLLRDQHVLWVTLLVVLFSSIQFKKKLVKREKVYSQ